MTEQVPQASEMLKRVARAIAESADDSDEGFARAAIEAIRESVETALTNALCHYIHPSDFNSCCQAPMGRKWCQLKAQQALEVLK